MKKFKSLICFIMATVMMLGTSMSVFAADVEEQYDGVAIECDYELPENVDDSSEYFCFMSPHQRMDSNGYFTFSYSWAMESDLFKPASSSIRLYMTATSSTSNQTYYINLYKVGSDSSLGTVRFTANGNSQYYDFSGLDTNSYYYLYFSKPLLSNSTITGSGHINYIQ